MNQMLNKKKCPRCLRKTMIGYRQGDHNPNPLSTREGIRVCMDCYMDELYAKFGVEA